MSLSILQATGQTKGLVLDPRTKIVLLLMVSIFVLGGAGSDKLPFVVPLLCAIPLLLLVVAGRYRQAFLYVLVFSGAYLAVLYLVPLVSGPLHYLLLACAGIFSRVVPGVVLGIYVVSTTTVSEFNAAMQKLHISEKLIIPLSVMFRFFPTIGEEFGSINAAMRMRGISLAGGNIGKMVEYRLVPLLACSARIGEDLSAAALTRGLYGQAKRTNVCQIGFRAQDYLIVAFCLAIFVATIAVDVIAL